MGLAAQGPSRGRGFAPPRVPGRHGGLRRAHGAGPDQRRERSTWRSRRDSRPPRAVDGAGDGRCLLVRLPAAEPRAAPTYAAVLWIARFRLEAVFQLAAWGTALLSTIVKWFMRRPRPVAGKDLRVVAAPLDGSSFPSGHVLTYVGVYGWMAIMADRLIRPRMLRRLVVAALTTLIAAVGPSRIYLGHHWPSDVAASYLLGSSYLAALLSPIGA